MWACGKIILVIKREIMVNGDRINYYILSLKKWNEIENFARKRNTTTYICEEIGNKRWGSAHEGTGAEEVLEKAEI